MLILEKANLEASIENKTYTESEMTEARAVLAQKAQGADDPWAQYVKRIVCAILKSQSEHEISVTIDSMATGVFNVQREGMAQYDFALHLERICGFVGWMYSFLMQCAMSASKGVTQTHM